MRQSGHRQGEAQERRCSSPDELPKRGLRAQRQKQPNQVNQQWAGEVRQEPLRQMWPGLQMELQERRQRLGRLQAKWGA